MDEPTSALTESETSVLLDLIISLKSDGVAIVYITHKLEELEHIGDWLTVLRDGRLVGSGRQIDYDRHSIVRTMVGERVTQKLTGKPKQQTSNGEDLFKAEHIFVENLDRPGHYLVEDVSLAVDRGELLGIFGLMGAGRTALLECLFGLRNESSRGNVLLRGQPLHINSPVDAIKAGIGFAPEDRKEEGLVLRMTVAENASLASLREFERFFLLDSSSERDQVRRLMDRLRIKAPSPSTPVINLSGGNQQKVVLAKWLATSPNLLMLDEPTRGIDVGAKQEIYSLIEELTETGLAVLLVSSDLPEIMQLSDRVMVMAEGRKTADFSREDADTESVMKAALHFQPTI
jgi:ribose transport system ATP-binding protein